MKENKKEIKLPKCPYCKSTELTYEVEYVENEYCKVTVICECGKAYPLTFECTMITKKEEEE